MEVENSEFLLTEVKKEKEDESIIEERDEKYPELYHEIYNAYKNKNYEACLQFIDSVTEDDYMEYQILKSACLIHSGRESKVYEAHQILDAALEKDPANAYTQYAKGLAYYHEDKWEESINYFEKAIELDEDEMERAEIMLEKANEKILERQETEILKKKYSGHVLGRMINRQKENLSIIKHRAAINSRKSRSGGIVRRFGCEICNHFFGKKYNLDRHNRSLHRRDTPRNFPTNPSKIAPNGNAPIIKEEEETDDEEDQEESSVESQNEPVVVPEKVTPVRGRRAIANFNIVREKRIRCPVCKSLFKKSSFARHMFIHSGNKPHKCKECPKAFFQKSDLNRHIATHSDILQFGCDICDRKFRIKKNLQVHNRRHHFA